MIRWTRTISVLAVAAVAALAYACSESGPGQRLLSPSGISSRVVGSGTQALVINEFMADPNAVTDANGEWFELYNPGSSAINIQGYQVASANDAGFTIASSVSVPSHGYVVLAKVASSATNGGVTVDYAYGSGVQLANTTDWLTLKTSTGTLVDSVAWTTTTAGKSWEVKNPAASHVTVGGTNWNLATRAYGAGDLGTPRAQNDSTAGGGGTGLPITVDVLDVGQGDANLIRNGTSTVIDSLGLDGATIDAVILSHQHADHLTGLLDLFDTSRNITIKYFFENKDVYSGVTLAKLRDSINARVARGQMIYRDTDDPCATGAPMCDVTMQGGAKLHILKPMPIGTDSDPNDRSVAVKLIGPDSASFTMWLAGDAEQPEIGWFLGASGYATNPGMHVNVLKGDHHGSCNGVTNAYITKVNPDWVTASVANSNTFGHMHNQAKALYAAHGKPWYRTDQNGTIEFRSAGTPGSGYTVMVKKGTTDMSGASDATSAQTVCNPIP
jgi:beta-lactamase superfamily II metal-dependent hydrolase